MVHQHFCFYQIVFLQLKYLSEAIGAGCSEGGRDDVSMIN